MSKPTKWEFSKIVVITTLVGAWAFVLFVCYEIHIQQSLEPITYIGTGIVGLLTVVIGAYMWRAKQKDLSDLEFKKIEKMAKLREQYGDNVQSETITQVNDTD